MGATQDRGEAERLSERQTKPRNHLAAPQEAAALTGRNRCRRCQSVIACLSRWRELQTEQTPASYSATSPVMPRGFPVRARYSRELLGLQDRHYAVVGRHYQQPPVNSSVRRT